MPRPRWVALAMLVLVGLVGTPTTSAAATDEVPANLPLQVSLGDSWGSGFGAPSGHGYVDLLHADLRRSWDCRVASAFPLAALARCPQLRLVNLSIGGATTASVIASQLPAAVELLERNQDARRHNDVQIVTLHTGGNDLFAPVINACAGGLTPSCLETIETRLADYRERLEVVVSTLRAAGGPNVEIVIGTYDNPMPTCDLAQVPGVVLLAALVLEGPDGVPGAPVDEGLHDVIRDVAAAYDAEVAESFGSLAPHQWIGGADCLHPNADGYRTVADAFLEALDLR